MESARSKVANLVLLLAGNPEVRRQTEYLRIDMKIILNWKV
jgi:hypothetical protein